VSPSPSSLSVPPVLRFAALASGGGSNLQAVLERIRVGHLPARLVFAASNNSGAQALERARSAGAPAYHVSAKTEGSDEGVTSRLLTLLDEHKPDLLVLAGYMKKVPDAVLKRMKNCVINIHPALLPEFGGAGMYGHHVHEAVVRAGSEFSGMTIHMVNENYDEGQIVLQRRVQVRKGADAAEIGQHVLALEHESYWQVVLGFAEGDIQPTDSDDPAQAVAVSEAWKRRMRNLSGTVIP
jgi:phosphoribosylglycinamide formyltransferase-1